jgi:hypothetical protein
MASNLTIRHIPAVLARRQPLIITSRRESPESEQVSLLQLTTTILIANPINPPQSSI